MEKKVIVAKEGPPALGAYSPAVMLGESLYVSGQLGVNADGQVVAGLEKQVNQALANLNDILKAAGMERDQVVKTTLFIKNMADFDEINVLYAAFFKTVNVFPARSCVEVAALPKNALFEMEAIAHR